MHIARVAWALKVKPEDVPEKDADIKKALENRRAEMRKVKHGKSIH